MARRRGRLVTDTTDAATAAAPSEACLDEEVARDLLARHGGRGAARACARRSAV